MKGSSIPSGWSRWSMNRDSESPRVLFLGEATLYPCELAYPFKDGPCSQENKIYVA